MMRHLQDISVSLEVDVEGAVGVSASLEVDVDGTVNKKEQGIFC